MIMKCCHYEGGIATSRGNRLELSTFNRQQHRINRLTFAAGRVAQACFVLMCAAVWIFGITPGEAWSSEEAQSAPVKVLFLGDQGHHRPVDFASILGPALEPRSVRLDYTEQLSDLNPEKLAEYDSLLIYANINSIEPAQEEALVEYLNNGGGLVVVHCGAFCFQNSNRYVAIVGGQFRSHGVGTFRVQILDSQHPAMHGLTSTDWTDETYIHHKIADDIHVLMAREQDGGLEPYTWTRDQGKGRVFYTALGHDDQTRRRPEFHSLIEQGILWASGRLQGLPSIAASGPVQQSASGPQTENFPEPLSPEESRKRMHVPDGLEVQLFASEPLIQNPMAMAFDERGRLWVLESSDYPNNVLPGSVGNDVVKILEDTDQDGRADTVKIFAEGLNIPTAIAFGGGGVIIGNTPDILLFRDLDGDDRADERKVLYTGFTRGDTHFEMNNFQYGHDNWIWGVLGAAGANVTAGGKNAQFQRGIFRFKPDGSAFEFMTLTSNNTYGLGFTPAGDVLASTANRDHSWFLGIPNRYFEAVHGWRGTGSRYNADHHRTFPINRPPRQWDFAGSFTAACNAFVYTGSQLPEMYHDRTMMVCEPTINIIHANLLQPAGAGLVSRDGFNLLASEDPWTAPVVARTGPDGAVWFLDLYSFTVLHNKPDEPHSSHGAGHAWVTAIRDRDRARIYRITKSPDSSSTGNAVPEIRSLSLSDVNQLLAALGHPNMEWRLHAQRLLVERNQLDIADPLQALVRGENVDSALHAFRTLQGLNFFENEEHGELLDFALQHTNQAVIRAALDALPKSSRSVTSILNAQLLNHASPFVRRDALLALSAMSPSDALGQEILSVLKQPENVRDEWIRQAAIAAAAANSTAFLAAAINDNQLSTASAEELDNLVRTIHIVATNCAQGGDLHGIPELLLLFPGREINARLKTALLQGLVDGTRKGIDVTLSEAEEKALRQGIASLTDEQQVLLIALSRRWKEGSLFDDLAQVTAERLIQRASDSTLEPAVKVNAARQVFQLGDNATVIEALMTQVDALQPPEVSLGILELLSGSSNESLGTQLVGRWTSMTPKLRAEAIDILIRRKVWTDELLKALDAGTVNFADLSARQRQQLALSTDADIATRFQQLMEAKGSAADPNRKKVIEELLPVTQTHGDVVRGRQVFQKNCIICHTRDGEGGKVGPDLTGMNIRSKAQLLTDILDPNRSVETNFRMWVIQTVSGQIFSGLIGAETQTSIEILDSAAKRHLLQRSDIEELVSRAESVMPTGLEKNISPEELTDLLEYLTSGGKYVPLSLESVANVVTTTPIWQEGMLHERLIFDSWSNRVLFGVPFTFIDPVGISKPNSVVLYGPNGNLSKRYPRTVEIPYHGSAAAIHFLGGIAGWGFPADKSKTVSMTVRLRYVDGATEDHHLVNGEHIADFYTRIDVPKSQFAFADEEGRQIRYFSLRPQRSVELSAIELIKGDDQTSPVVMSITVEVLPQSPAAQQ
ncbi:PVC-type heme-binding CxxCH protein [Planctomicrobium sp. SH661]|uniref:PVC-type heme-binding CxxCH protein n=1 Tax=Planctomicrobium sp. SH661 TaxID=3448124 RepID=UPI003F5B8D09